MRTDRQERLTYTTVALSLSLYVSLCSYTCRRVTSSGVLCRLQLLRRKMHFTECGFRSVPQSARFFQRYSRAAVLVARITGLARPSVRPSVCLSVPWGSVITR